MDRVIYAACDDLRMVKAGNADAPVWSAAHEIGSAINRVDHPGNAGRAGLVPIFLTQNPVFGKVPCNRLANQYFNAAIGIADKIVAGFFGNLEFIDLLEMVECHPAAVPGKLLD